MPSICILEQLTHTNINTKKQAISTHPQPNLIKQIEGTPFDDTMYTNSEEGLAAPDRSERIYSTASIDLASDYSSGNESSSAATTESEIDTSSSSTSSEPAEWDSRRAADWDDSEPQRPPTPVTLSFSDPLPTSPEPLLRINPDRHPFLTTFFEDERYTDISFSISHRLLRFVAGLAAEAAFEFLRRDSPDGVKLFGKLRTSADECELQHWIQAIMDWGLASDKIGNKFRTRLEEFRNYATHHWVYTTYEMLPAIRLFMALGDEERLVKLETVLEIVYSQYSNSSQTREITAEEEDTTDLALGLLPIEPVTQYQTLYEVQSLLEETLFEYAHATAKSSLATVKWDFANDSDGSELPPGTEPTGINCPERMELQRWKEQSWIFCKGFPVRKHIYDPDQTDNKLILQRLDAAHTIRNWAAHPVSRPDGYRPTPLYVCLGDVAELMRDLGYEVERERILWLREKPCLGPIFDYEAVYAETLMKDREERKVEARKQWAESLAESAASSCDGSDVAPELSDGEDTEGETGEDSGEDNEEDTEKQTGGEAEEEEANKQTEENHEIDWTSTWEQPEPEQLDDILCMQCHRKAEHSCSIGSW